MKIQPVAVGLVVLGLIFVSEYLVMVVLPWLLPSGPSRLLEAAVDAIVLTSLTAPVLYWLLVRPLCHAMFLQGRFLAHSLSSIEAERRRLAYELHDGVGQSLTLLVSGLKSLRANPTNSAEKRMEELESVAKSALKDIKTLSLGLRPSLLDDLGLAPAVERIVADMREHYPIEIHVDAAAIAGRRLTESAENALFRIIQESLNNVVKHSGASRAQVKIYPTDGSIVAAISDNGSGIEPDVLARWSASPEHLGLIGMHERVALLNGTLSIDAAPGKGTRIVVAIPAAHAARPDAEHAPGRPPCEQIRS